MADGTHGFRRSFPSLARVVRSFPQHYLLYASHGAIRLELDRVIWLLPPQRAAWIAAGTDIAVMSDTPFTTCSVLFDTPTIPAPDFACRVFAMSPLAREMAQYAMRWGPGRDPDDPVANGFFGALAAVCAELYAQPDLFWLPRARSPQLRQVVDTVLSQLDAPWSVAQAATLAGMSERTLARRFEAELSMGWRVFLHRARMIRAMELLAEPRHKILSIAHATGFASPGAFTSAILAFCGETPSSYRKRLL